MELDNLFATDPELERKKQEFEEKKSDLRMIGSLGDAFANSQGIGNYYLGRMNPHHDVSGGVEKQIDDMEDPVKADKERIANVLSQYKLKMEERQNADKMALERRLADIKEKEADTSARKVAIGAQKAPKGFTYQTDAATGNVVIVPTLTKLPADKVISLSEGNQVPGLLGDLENTVNNNKESFGPFVGRIGALNPYNETSKTIDAQVRSVRQTVGKLREGGVLRKEDEDKYAKMLPELKDTPEVAINKIQLVARELAKKQSDAISALEQAGYDVSSVKKPMQVPEIPNSIAGSQKKSSDLIPSANAGSGSVDAETIQAAQWLSQNWDHADAGPVKQKLRALNFNVESLNPKNKR